MLRRHFVALSALAAMTLTANANEAVGAGVVQATAAQIQTLLSGNTIEGTWSGSKYKQFFGESGFTVYVPEGGPPSRGKWRVKEETDEYDSWWENTGWTPYKVMITNDGYAWVNKGTLEPFEVLQGRQVDF